MTSTVPSFRTISQPIDADDDALEKINDRLGVPTMTRPPKQEAAPRPATPPAPRATTPEKLTVEAPGYLMDALRREAADKRVSMRHVVLSALNLAGYEVQEADLIPDGRRKAKP